MKRKPTERRENIKKKDARAKCLNRNAPSIESAVFVHVSEQCNHARKSVYQKDGYLMNSSIINYYTMLVPSTDLKIGSMEALLLQGSLHHTDT